MVERTNPTIYPIIRASNTNSIAVIRLNGDTTYGFLIKCIPNTKFKIGCPQFRATNVLQIMCTKAANEPTTKATFLLFSAFMIISR